MEENPEVVADNEPIALFISMVMVSMLLAPFVCTADGESDDKSVVIDDLVQPSMGSLTGELIIAYLSELPFDIPVITGNGVIIREGSS